MATGQHVSPKRGAVPMRSRQSESLGQPQPALHHTHTQAPRTLSCIKYTFDSHFCLPTVEQVGPTLRQGTGPRRAETRAPGGNGCPKSRFRASRKPERRRLGTNSTRGPECWHRPPGPHLIPAPPLPPPAFTIEVSCCLHSRCLTYRSYCSWILHRKHPAFSDPLFPELHSINITTVPVTH